MFIKAEENICLMYVMLDKKLYSVEAFRMPSRLFRDDFPRKVLYPSDSFILHYISGWD